MHELSVATSLVELAEDAARRAGAEQIHSLRVHVGALSGVVIEALEFACPIASEGTMCEGAAIELVPIPARVLCRSCGHRAEMQGIGPFICPACGSPSPEIIAGNELELVSMEVQQNEAANTRSPHENPQKKR